MVHAVEAAVVPQRGHELGVTQIAFYPVGRGRDVLEETAREVVGGNHLHAEIEARISDVRSMKPAAPVTRALALRSIGSASLSRR